VSAGRRWQADIYSRLGTSMRNRCLLSFLLAIAVLTAVLAFRLSLPAISAVYYARGLAQRKWGELQVASHLQVGASRAPRSTTPRGETTELQGAMESFRRAVALDPDNKHAHFALGNGYRAIQDYDRAIAEYQKVLEIDMKHRGANNNLALVLLIR